MGCEPLQKPVQPPKQPGKAEDAEEEVKAAAGKKKGGKASVAEKRKSGKVSYQHLKHVADKHSSQLSCLKSDPFHDATST